MLFSATPFPKPVLPQLFRPLQLGRHAKSFPETLGILRLTSGRAPWYTLIASPRLILPPKVVDPVNGGMYLLHGVLSL